MAQEPMTSAGVQQKFSDLYALSDPLLEAEADLIASDFSQWVKDNFQLDTAQTNYLDGLDDEFIALAAASTSFVARNRQPITYEPPFGPPGVSKIIRIISNLNSAGIGSLVFEVYYE